MLPSQIIGDGRISEEGKHTLTYLSGLSGNKLEPSDAFRPKVGKAVAIRSSSERFITSLGRYWNSQMSSSDSHFDQVYDPVTQVVQYGCFLL